MFQICSCQHTTCSTQTDVVCTVQYVQNTAADKRLTSYYLCQGISLNPLTQVARACSPWTPASQMGAEFSLSH